MRGITLYFVEKILTVLPIMISALPADLSSHTMLGAFQCQRKTMLFSCIQ